MKCKKHQWDYVGNYSIGKEPIAIDRKRFAKWICPYCGEIKLIELEGGKKNGKIKIRNR